VYVGIGFSYGTALNLSGITQGSGLALGNNFLSMNEISYNQTHDYMSPSEVSLEQQYNNLAVVTAVGSGICSGIGILASVFLQPEIAIPAFSAATWLGATSTGYRIAAWASNPSDSNLVSAAFSAMGTAFDIATMGMARNAADIFLNSARKIEGTCLINSVRIELQAREAMLPGLIGLSYTGMSEAYSGIPTQHQNYITGNTVLPPYYYQYLNSGGNVNNNNQYGYYSRP
jgi:hypothetical protein